MDDLITLQSFGNQMINLQQDIVELKTFNQQINIKIAELKTDMRNVSVIKYKDSKGIEVETNIGGAIVKMLDIMDFYSKKFDLIESTIATLSIDKIKILDFVEKNIEEILPICEKATKKKEQESKKTILTDVQLRNNRITQVTAIIMILLDRKSTRLNSSHRL